jgi:hypothetical protein
LAERRIKVGDLVVVGSEGYVRKISVRSTEIETSERARVLVPNSFLITEKVKNWTLMVRPEHPPVVTPGVVKPRDSSLPNSRRRRRRHEPDARAGIGTYHCRRACRHRHISLPSEFAPPRAARNPIRFSQRSLRHRPNLRPSRASGAVDGAASPSGTSAAVGRRMQTKAHAASTHFRISRLRVVRSANDPLVNTCMWPQV